MKQIEIDKILLWGTAIIVGLVVLHNLTKTSAPEPLTTAQRSEQACIEEATYEWIRLSDMLQNKWNNEIMAGHSGLESELAQRRLKESYCRKWAACGFINSNKQRNPRDFSLSFSVCVDDSEESSTTQ